MNTTYSMRTIALKFNTWIPFLQTNSPFRLKEAPFCWTSISQPGLCPSYCLSGPNKSPLVIIFGLLIAVCKLKVRCQPEHSHCKAQSQLWCERKPLCFLDEIFHLVLRDFTIRNVWEFDDGMICKEVHHLSLFQRFSFGDPSTDPFWH